MTDAATRATIVIPAFEPTPALIDLVHALGPDRPVLVVDDGSSPEFRAVFATLEIVPNVTVLVHAVNLGKGQALKTAFNHFLLHASPESVGIVTADADGQHLPGDVCRVAEALEQSPSALVFGGRRFEGRVPLRSRIGNVLTRVVFRFVIGAMVQDTQTGLRGIPRAFVPDLIKIEAGRYEFELEMLVRAAARRMPIQELPIETVYGVPGQSHFDPLRDSLRIYFVFIRFVGLSVATALIDYTTFFFAYGATRNILAATALARTVAGTFNFTYNRTVVFRSRGALAFEALKYATLVASLMGVSYAMVTTFVVFGGFGVYASKLLAEGILFAASFALQDLFVFAGTRDDRPVSPARTDWDAYYRRPGVFTPFTRRVTTRAVESAIARFAGRPVRHIVELGAGSSIVLGALAARFPEARLSAVDSNETGLRLLASRFEGDARLTIHRGDILDDTPSFAADVVYSIGLIEHFDERLTARAIERHFAHVRPGGLVLVTFPTPTWLYRLVRGAAEAARVWAFPDERPLSIDEVARQVVRYGDIVAQRINWAVVLTQAMIVARRAESPAAVLSGR